MNVYEVPYHLSDDINFAEDSINQTGNFEDSTFPPREKKVRHRKKQLFREICAQMEFYFSDANLTKDRFLSKLLSDQGGIDVSVFLGFNKISALTTNPLDIAKAVRLSDFLQVSEDNTKIFRTTPVTIKDNVDDCTIYVERIPSNVDHDWVKNIFSAYGKVVYVSIPRFKESLTNKGFAFVEYDTPEEAQNALKAFESVSCYLTETGPEELCSIKTFEGNQEETDGKVVNTVDTLATKTSDIKDISKCNKHLEMENNTGGATKKMGSIPVCAETVKASGKDCKESEEKKGIRNSNKMEKKVKFITDHTGNNSLEKKSQKIKNDLEAMSTEKMETQLLGDEDKNGLCQEPRKKICRESKLKSLSCSVIIEEPEEESRAEKELHAEQEEKANKILERHEKKGKVKRKVLETIFEETEDESTPCKKKKLSVMEENLPLLNETTLPSDYESEKESLQNASSIMHVEQKQCNDCSNPDENLDESSEQEKLFTATKVDTGTNDMGEVYLIDSNSSNKRKRRRSKKKKNKLYEEENGIELRVLSKRDWKKLRNKYLNIQRESMKKLKHQVRTKNRIFSECLKQHSNKRLMLQRSALNMFDSRDAALRLKADSTPKHTPVVTNHMVNGSASISYPNMNGISTGVNHHRNASFSGTSTVSSLPAANHTVNGTANQASAVKSNDDDAIFKRPYDVPRRSVSVVSHSAKGPKFKPAVIVHIVMDNPVDPKMFREEAKSHFGVKYVDINKWGTEVYLRCLNWQVATKLIDERHWNNMRLLRGQEEQAYWHKIMSDRKAKFDETAKVKLNGRKKVLKKAEKALGKHIRFDD